MSKPNTEMFYRDIISEVCKIMREEFPKEEISEDVILELQNIWIKKMKENGIFTAQNSHQFPSRPQMMNSPKPSFDPNNSTNQNIKSYLDYMNTMNNMKQSQIINPLYSQPKFTTKNVIMPNNNINNNNKTNVKNIPKNVSQDKGISNQNFFLPNDYSMNNMDKQGLIFNPPSYKLPEKNEIDKFRNQNIFPQKESLLMDIHNNPYSKSITNNTNTNNNIIQNTNLLIKDEINENNKNNNNIKKEEEDPDLVFFEGKFNNDENNVGVNDDENVSENLSSLKSESIVEDDPKDYLLAQYIKVHRVKNKWKVKFKDAILHFEDKEYIYQSITGELDRDW